jgi:hypothetical protein
MPGIPTPPEGAAVIERQKTDFPTIPATDEYRTPTILNVEVEDVQLRPLREDFRLKYNVEATHEFNFRFRVQDGPFAKRVVFGSAKAEWDDGPGCRLRLWAQEIMGVDAFPTDYEFDSDHLVGQNCRITIKNYTKKDGSIGESAADVLRAIPTSAAQGVVPSMQQQQQFMPGTGLGAVPDDEYEPF